MADHSTAVYGVSKTCTILLRSIAPINPCRESTIKSCSPIEAGAGSVVCNFISNGLAQARVTLVTRARKEKLVRNSSALTCA